MVPLSLSLDHANQDETVWNCRPVPQRSQVRGPILGGQVVYDHSPWFQTESLGLSWRLGVLVHLFFSIV